MKPSTKQASKKEKQKKIRSIKKIKEKEMAAKLTVSLGEELTKLCGDYLERTIFQQTPFESENTDSIIITTNFLKDIANKIADSAKTRPAILDKISIALIIEILGHINTKIIHNPAFINENTKKAEIFSAVLKLINSLRKDCKIDFNNQLRNFDECLDSTQELVILNFYPSLIQWRLIQSSDISGQNLELAKQYLSDYSARLEKITPGLSGPQKDCCYTIFYAIHALVAVNDKKINLAVNYIAKAEPYLLRAVEKQGTPVGLMLSAVCRNICTDLMASDRKEYLIKAIYLAEKRIALGEEIKKIFEQKYAEIDNNPAHPGVDDISRGGRLFIDELQRESKEYKTIISVCRHKLFTINYTDLTQIIPNGPIISYSPDKQKHAIKCSLSPQCDKELLSKCLDEYNISFTFDNNELLLAGFDETDLTLFKLALQKYDSLLAQKKESASRHKLPTEKNSAAAAPETPANVTPVTTESTYRILAATEGTPARRNKIDKSMLAASASASEGDTSVDTSLVCFQTDASPERIVLSDGRTYEKFSYTSSEKLDGSNCSQYFFKLSSTDPRFRHSFKNTFICVDKGLLKNVPYIQQERLIQAITSGRVITDDSKNKVGIVILNDRKKGEKFVKIKDYSCGSRFGGSVIEDSDGNTVCHVNSYRRKHR